MQSEDKYILVTGGAGYIGSHTIVELAKENYKCIAIDNFSNSSVQVEKRIESIIHTPVNIIDCDIRDSSTLKTIFNDFNIDTVIHFAGIKAVGESVENPLSYYDNNVLGTVTLLQVMKEFNCKKIVFSSSATVYGSPDSMPIKENFPVGNTTNPYGTTKFMIERILEDLYISDNSFKIAILRYFNPIGAHQSGLLGEEPNGIPNNLMPYLLQVAIGKREYLSIYGNDYNTLDGTGMRDYIHVVDLALGHIKAIKYLHKKTSMEPLKVNLGTGTGYSVLDVVKTFERVTGITIPYKIADRREGDIEVCYTDTTYAKEVIGWKATRNLEMMCLDSWNWIKNNK